MRVRLNKWVKYVDRSYTQIIDSIRSAIASDTFLSTLITNLGKTDLFYWFIGIYAGIAEMIGLYIDNAARELYIGQTRLFRNANQIAKTFGYFPRCATASQVNLRFYVNEPATANTVIPIGTIVSTDNDILFRTLENVTLLTGESEVFVDAIQISSVITDSDIGISNGLSFQNYEILTNINTFVQQGSVSIVIDTENWQPVPNFIDSFQESQHFIQTLSDNRNCSIEFGNDLKGAIPLLDANITASYSLTQGSEGNVASNQIVNIESVITSDDNILVMNLTPATGGSDYESLEDLRNRVPTYFLLQARSLERAVTETDYELVAMQFQGVTSAKVDYKCGKFVDIFILPDGGGFITNTLRSDLTAYFDTRKMLTTSVKFRDAGRLRLVLDVSVQPLRNVDRLDLKSRIETNLLEFLNPPTQFIGKLLAKGDVFEVMENTIGVDYSIIRNFFVYPAPIANESEMPILVANFTMNEVIEKEQWLVSFNSPTNFDINRGDSLSSFVGNFNTGDTITTDSFTLVISSNDYIAGYRYTFNTYEKNSNIDIGEPSLIELDIADLNVRII